MTPLVNFVQIATYDLTPTQNRLSPILWTVFTALNKVHLAWRWYRRAEIYRQPDNLIHLVAGNALNYFVGDLILVRLAAQCLLVSTRLLDCVHQQLLLKRAGRRWIKSIKGEYSKTPHISWNKSSFSFLSPSTIYWWKLTGLSLFERIKKVAFCTLKLFKAVFQLSMSIMDVVDAFCWSPNARQEAIGEGFVNISTSIGKIVENKEELLDGLAENKKIIERLLKHSSITYEQMESAVEKTIEKAETLHKGMKAISSFGGQAASRLGKKAVHGTLGVMGLGKILDEGIKL